MAPHTGQSIGALVLNQHPVYSASRSSGTSTRETGNIAVACRYHGISR